MLEKEQKELILSKIEFSLRNYNLGDIKKSREKNMLIASFILANCFISQLSSYRYFKIIKRDEQRFIEFIKNYFENKYTDKAQELYKDLRSKLVHNYSVSGRYLLSDEKIEDHLCSDVEGKIFLNIDAFIGDVETAFEKYIHQLNTDPEIQNTAIKHYNKFKILS